VQLGIERSVIMCAGEKSKTDRQTGGWVLIRVSFLNRMTSLIVGFALNLLLIDLLASSISKQLSPSNISLLPVRGCALRSGRADRFF
jgi:hypothetical protein